MGKNKGKEAAGNAGNRINLELPEPVYKKLRGRADAVGISVGDVVRVAVNEYLERIESKS